MSVQDVNPPESPRIVDAEIVSDPRTDGGLIESKQLAHYEEALRACAPA